MNKSESIMGITKAIIAVMKSVVGIDKSLTVGSGNSAYKGVSDKDVKNIVGNAMEANGLCIVPIETTPTLRIDRWEQEEFYNGKSSGIKQKQQVFTEVQTKYLLLHTSGEWIELSGYGHGVDTQDKAAGKATTYAMKYVLLYTFMVPTGKIDDADEHHSNDFSLPPKRATIKDAKLQAEEIKAAVMDLIDCNSVDDLKKLKAQLPDYVKKNESFIEHATQRYNELMAETV